MMNALVIYLSLVFVMSVVCFATYGVDKRRARSEKHRPGGRRGPAVTKIG